MTTQVTVTLPDDTVRRAEYLAQLTGRAVADVLAETILLSLDPLGAPLEVGQPLEALPDTEVLQIAGSAMDHAQDQRLRRLLEVQQGAGLSPEERASLLALLQVYQDGLLRKAQALRVAVQRGLRPRSRRDRPRAHSRTCRHPGRQPYGYCRSAQRHLPATPVGQHHPDSSVM